MFYRFSAEALLDGWIALLNLFYDDYVDCHYVEAVRIFEDHCDETKEKCDIQQVLRNVEANVFIIVSTLSSFGDVVENWHDMDQEEIEDLSLQFGKDISKLLRMVFGVKKQRFPHGDRRTTLA